MSDFLPIGTESEADRPDGAMLIRSILIDDEPKNIRILRGLLEEFCPGVQIVGEANSAEQAIPIIQNLKPDLLFLDIEMPFGNAFDLIDRLKPVDFEIIFITAFDDYTIRAFKYSALDYLLKPVNIDELREAVDRAAKRLEHKNINKQLTNLLHNFKKSPNVVQRIALPDKHGSMVFLEVDQIIYIETKKGYSYVHSIDGEVYNSARSIREYEDMLPPDSYFRIHHSCLINMAHIKKYHKGRGGVVEMQDGLLLEVAARRKEEFLKRFKIG